MHRKKLLNDLERYAFSSFYFPEEQATLEQFKNFIKNNAQCFDRSNSGHVTSSTWIVNHDFSKVLLTHHKKLQMWIQLGGHNDGDADCTRVALKEAQEESGIEKLQFLTPDILDIDIHLIPSACAYHYDVRYLLQAVDDAYTVSAESLDLAWIDMADLHQYSDKQSIIRMNKKFQIFRFK